MRKATYQIACILSGFALCLGCSSKRVSQPAWEPSGRYSSYSESVQPIFNRRCVVCHSCNDAPCQLDNSAFAGVDRGASDEDVYADRFFSMEPSRLFVDEKSTSGWRSRGFFPVIQHHPEGDPRNLEDSILYRLINYRRGNPLPKMKFDGFSSRNCPNLVATLPRIRSEIAEILSIREHADLGMPYGFPALDDEEFAAIRDWLAKGAPAPEEMFSQSPAEQLSVKQFEQFLNRADAKQKLVSRYLYEHLFYAHLYFTDHHHGAKPGHGKPNFYRLVRSKSGLSGPIDEIATRLPYSSAGDTFTYRLRPIESTIVHKTHLAFPVSESVLARWETLFFGEDWQLSEAELPEYGTVRAANPFVTFRRIPPRGRYQFMLDNAEYFVASFMKGPVCRGQLALNVIDDHFFLFFLNPDADQSITSDAFFKKTARLLITPFRPEDLFSNSEKGSLWSILELPVRAIKQLRQSFYPYYKSRQLEYLRIRDSFYAKARPEGYSLEDIWNGDGVDTNAVLTVFRHHDSASVKRGAWGGMPKTSLVLDYPIFERMYYNLVVSFDIYGDIKSQLATRLYMDDLRIEGEDLFLSFLPRKFRLPIREFWYRKAEEKMADGDYPLYGANVGTPRGTEVRFSTDNPKEEFIDNLLRERIVHHLGGTHDLLNRSRLTTYATESTGRKIGQLENALSKLGGRHWDFLSIFPELWLVRFRGEPAGGFKDSVYTFVLNRAHFNVKYLFDEESRFAPMENTLSILKEFHGSYPNFFFDVKEGDAAHFIESFTQLRVGDESFRRFIDTFGVRRSNPDFWSFSDALAERFETLDTNESGVLDLSRYENY